MINQLGRLTIAQAARRGFGSYQQLYRSVKKSQIRGVKEGHNVYIEINDLLKIYGDPDKGENNFVGISDIAKRWRVSIQAVHKKMQTDSSFPKPVARINNLKTYVFAENDIRSYESVNEIGVPVGSRFSQKKWFVGRLYDHGFRGWKTGYLHYRASSRSVRQEIKQTTEARKKSP